MDPAQEIVPVGPTVTFQRKPKRKRQPRVICIDTLHYQQPDSQPTTIPNQFIRYLESDEQPYSRLMKVGPEWTPLDHGWVEEASFVVLKNVHEIRIPLQGVTPETKRVVKEHTIEVTFDTSDPEHVFVTDILLLPGESVRFSPRSIKDVSIRCSGGTKCLVNVFPS